jgi:stage III sporulation protein AB
VWLKLSGAGCLILAAGLLGERGACRIRRALATSEAFLVSLTVLEAEIAYLATNLADSFHKAAQAAPLVAPFYASVGIYMAQGMRPADAWRSAVQDWRRTRRLSEREAAVLAGLAAAWGPWSAEDHVRHIQLAGRLLQQEQERARDRLEAACRMWRYLGVAGGMIMALLLF